VVVVVEARVLQRLGLSWREHAERDAGLEAERLHAFDHRGDARDVSRLRLAPGGPHAEARRAVRLRGTRRVEHLVERHQRVGVDARVVMRGLRTVRAVLRAAAGLDRQQRRQLDSGGIEVLAMNLLRTEDQVAERQLEQLEHRGRGPQRSGSVRRARDARPVHGDRSCHR
jgi:hypothetical protein